MGSIFTDYRRWLLVLIAVVVWLSLCLPFLVANRPDAFQASGSIIVVMAILIYARERARRENVVTQAQRSQILAMLEEHDKWGAYHESRMTRSAMENELQLLELRRSVEQLSTKDIEPATRIDQLRQSLEQGSENHDKLYQEMQSSHTSWVKVHKNAEKVVQLEAPAAKNVERLEIALVVFGTLQWGYGDRWVENIHNLF